MERTNKKKSLTRQIERKSLKVGKKKKPKSGGYDGDVGEVISTGSTLLDLAISGGRVRGGGIPLGILVEIFGPSGSGKTVLLSELAGDVQRKGGDIIFHDPEARINKLFAKVFDLDLDLVDYKRPNTVPEVFKAVREWKPSGDINGIFADSLAALSTDLEMDREEGDKMGGRRAKEFSEELRKTCRILAEKNLLMVCSNQIRQNMNAGQFEEKFKSPGGEAIPFYSSLRLRTYKPQKIKKTLSYAGKSITRVVGIDVKIEVYKSTVWKPYHTAPITLFFDYGIDDIRQNLQFVKDYTRNTIYAVGDNGLDHSMDKAVLIVERDNLEDELKEQVIDLWEDMESKFDLDRKVKKR